MTKALNPILELPEHLQSRHLLIGLISQCAAAEQLIAMGCCFQMHRGRGGLTWGTVMWLSGSSQPSYVLVHISIKTNTDINPAEALC